MSVGIFSELHPIQTAYDQYKGKVADRMESLKSNDRVKLKDGSESIVIRKTEHGMYVLDTHQGVVFSRRDLEKI